MSPLTYRELSDTDHSAASAAPSADREVTSGSKEEVVAPQLHGDVAVDWWTREPPEDDLYADREARA